MRVLPTCDVYSDSGEKWHAHNTHAQEQQAKIFLHVCHSVLARVTESKTQIDEFLGIVASL
jgi:hypothetical protein